MRIYGLLADSLIVRVPTAAELKMTAEAKRAFADVIAAGGRVVVTTSLGNGGRPVAVVVAPGFDPSQPARVHTHYHGDLASAVQPGGQGTKAIRQMLFADPQRVFVLPEAQGNVGSAPTDWNNVVSERDTTADALAAAGIFRLGEKTVSAHSAGGRALARAIARNAVGADRIVLIDCLYRPVWTQLRDDLVKYGQDVRELVVVRGYNEKDRVRSVLAAFGARARSIEIGDVGDDNAHFAALRWMMDGTDARAPRS